MSNDSERDMIFISHASEDNEFSLWLALQLAKEGYGVWCDLTKLLGGENWPNEINQALQTRTQKFLFVLSKYSNKKHDPQGELTAAFNIVKKEKFKNFIVPLRVDDLELDKIDFRLQNIQSVPFGSWPEGLSQLLRMLERENIKKHESFSPDAVNQWWKNYKSVDSVISYTPESLFSNRFRIISYPQDMFVHHVAQRPYVKDFVLPVFIPFKQYLLSFADAEALRQHVDLEILGTEKVNIAAVVDGKYLVENGEQGQYLITRLFNQSLWKGFRSKGLLPYSLSGNKTCFYFHEGLLPDGRIIYGGHKELSLLIKLWGDTLGEKWHWAIRGRFDSLPLWHYNIQSHILVSDKSGDIRSAPKRVYYRWNNSTWRDRLRAAMLHLAGENETVVFPVGNDQAICIDKNPVLFISPITFMEPKAEGFAGDEDE
jgi:hypothetical protein